ELAKTRLELAVDLTKALAWPIFAVVVLITFWVPLHQLAMLAPSLIGQSESITIAGVSIKLGKQLSGKASPEVRKILAGMSPHSIESLLSHTGSAYWDSDPSYGRAENAQLVSLGLLREMSPEELRKYNPGKNYVYGIELTSRGREVREFLLA